MGKFPIIQSKDQTLQPATGEPSLLVRHVSRRDRRRLDQETVAMVAIGILQTRQDHINCVRNQRLRELQTQATIEQNHQRRQIVKANTIQTMRDVSEIVKALCLRTQTYLREDVKRIAEQTAYPESLLNMVN